ncbi:MAG: precorrin-8X methylmutase [Magnetococcales bacterium]|nr:precorrin-8X methylmutase [Magnetococcales bacterium]
MNRPLLPPIVPAGAAIEAASFRLIEAEIGEQEIYDAQQWPVVRRLIHTSGDFALHGLTAFHPAAITEGVAALSRGAPLIVDVEMIRAGLTSRRLTPLGLTVHQWNADPQVIAQAQAEGTTRSVQAMRHGWRSGLLTGSVVAIGNAPTALLELIRLVRQEGVRPALVIGVPVGFIAAAESKEALMTLAECPWITIRGTKGGSTLAVAALHALMDLALESRP